MQWLPSAWFYCENTWNFVVVLGNSQYGIGPYVGSWMLVPSIWDGAEMWQPLTILDCKCSVKYCSVCSDKRCLFPFSVWEMMHETSQLVGPTVTRPITPKCGVWYSKLSEEQWLGLEETEGEYHWAKKASLEHIVKWGSLKKLNMKAKLS